ncbi:hypothetical protein R3W88_029698 [Solanum pinnatisectum]|uniref:DUF4283 domain-containing protein n=1 Tax=Solanum pinnatisectum TaxID=50273 RepID=A0AAV9K640_9SOLN|nr:hypothetical protein R3W88_029698 [Solanum pinnatisectum]
MAGNIYFTTGEKSFEVVEISEDHSRWFLWIERSRRFTSKIKIDVNNLIWVCQAMKQASRGTRGLCRRCGRKVEAYIYRVVQNFNMYGRFVRIKAVLGDWKSSVIIPKIICNGGWVAEKILGHLRSTSKPPRLLLNAIIEVQNFIKISHVAELDSSKFLSQCLIGIFNDPFHSSPNTDVIQKWFLNRWKITAGLKITPLSHNQFLFEMPSRQEAARIMWWSPVAGTKIDAPISKFQWVKALGISLHAWLESTFKVIGNMCGGFMDTDEDTKRRNHLYWARIYVKKSGTVLPNKIKLEVGDRNFEITILIDTHAKFWVAENSKRSAEDSNVTNDGKREALSLAPLKFIDRLVGQHVICPELSKF